MSTILLVLFPGLLAVMAQHPRTVGGTILGAVAGEDGTVVTGTISLHRTNVRTKSRLPIQTEWRAALDEKGAFRFAFLPSGQYFACVRAAKGLWLDPCEWDESFPTASILDEKSTTELKIVLRQGTAVQVRVDDPGGLRSQHEGKTAGAGMMVAIASDGLVLRFVPVISTDAVGRTHQLIVPYERALRLIVQSGFFKVSDSLGVPLRETEATVVPFTVAKGKDLAPIGLRIAGTKR